MQNPFQHINDVLNYSGKEAYRMLGNQVNTEHLMLGILHCNNKQVNDIFEHFGINTDVCDGGYLWSYDSGDGK